MVGRFKPQLVASLDMLGTSDLFKSDNEIRMEKFIDNMNGVYNLIAENMSYCDVKTFSDNVLLSTDDLSESNILSFLMSVASLQFNTICDMRILMRGGIVLDQLYTSGPDDVNKFVIGRALVDAYEMESKKAIYPRVLVSKKLVDYFENNGYKKIPFIKKPNTDHSFIDYLMTTVDSEGFLDRDKLRKHRSALIDHVKDDLEMKDDKGTLNGRVWDSIRSKDVWALAYHNDFCSRNHADDCRVNFTECYHDDRIIIEFKEEEL